MGEIADAVQLTKLEFSIKELNLAIGRLGRNKASGYDDVSAEHVIYSGVTTRMLLLTMVNKLLSAGYTCIPQSFKRAVIIPIHKGKGKPVDDPGNYRGISLITTFCKIVKHLLKPLIVSRLLDSDVPDELQHGFQEEHSCSLTAVALNFIIESNAREGVPTFMPF